MTFLAPWFLVAAALVAGAGVAGYLAIDRRRTRTLAETGLAGAAVGRRRHLAPVLLGAGIVVLVATLARPAGTIGVPRLSSTVVLVMDVSNSMLADDVRPSRLGAARLAAEEFIAAQGPSIDVGIVSFGDGALTALQPTADRDEALAAVGRLAAGGGTSLGEGVLAALSVITGSPVDLPRQGAPPPDLGRWESASIVVISDGEQTGGPDPLAAAELAAAAGVRIEALGIGTRAGAVIEVDGYRVATRLEEASLRALAQATGGGYRHGGEDGVVTTVEAVGSRFRLVDEQLELTGIGAGLAVLLLTAGAAVMVARTGRVL